MRQWVGVIPVAGNIHGWMFIGRAPRCTRLPACSVCLTETAFEYAVSPDQESLQGRLKWKGASVEGLMDSVQKEGGIQQGGSVSEVGCSHAGCPCPLP